MICSREGASVTRAGIRDTANRQSIAVLKKLKLNAFCRVPTVVKVAWDAGDAVPHLKYMVECVPHVRYLNGRTGSVTGTRETMQKSSILKLSAQLCRT